MLIKLLINNCEKMVKTHLPWNEKDILLHSTKNQILSYHETTNQRSSSAWRRRTKSPGLRFEIYKGHLPTSICQATSVQCGITAMLLLIYEGLRLSKVRRWHDSSLKANLSLENSDFLSQEAMYRFISWSPCGFRPGNKSEKPDITSHEATSNIIGWG